MQSTINPYINLKGNAREAVEFYKDVFGASVDMNTFEEFNMAQNPEDAEKIMHAQLEVDGKIILMVSDVPESMPHNPGGTVTISLSGDNEEEIRSYWEKLSDGALTTMPLDKAPWGDTFGMVTDKFGINWMVNINAK